MSRITFFQVEEVGWKYLPGNLTRMSRLSSLILDTLPNLITIPLLGNLTQLRDVEFTSLPSLQGLADATFAGLQLNTLVFSSLPLSSMPSSLQGHPYTEVAIDNLGIEFLDILTKPGQLGFLQIENEPNFKGLPSSLSRSSLTQLVLKNVAGIANNFPNLQGTQLSQLYLQQVDIPDGSSSSILCSAPNSADFSLHLQDVTSMSSLPRCLQNYFLTRILKCSNCGLTEFPSSLLSAFSVLEHLDLSDNHIPSFPSNVFRSVIPSLKEFIIDGNDLGGVQLPGDLFVGATSLTWISVRRCHLTGPFPSTVNQSESLTMISASNNEFDVLDWSQFTHLKIAQMDFSHNLLTHLPSLLTIPYPMTIFDISSNPTLKRTQLLPYWLIPTIQTLNMSNCGLVGHITAPLSSNLFSIDLSNNFIDGNLPSFDSSSPTSLSIFKVQNNRLSGTIPSSWARAGGFLNRIQTLDLSNNLLSGSFPIHQGPSYAVDIRIDHNAFTGGLPFTSISTSPRLSNFVADHNNFDLCSPPPLIPSTLQTCNLSYNKCPGAGSCPDSYKNTPCILDKCF